MTKPFCPTSRVFCKIHQMKIFYRFLFLAILLGLVPLSCDDCIPQDSCDCQGPPPNSPDFEITEMDSELLSISPQKPVDTSGFQDAENLAMSIMVTGKKDVAAHVKPRSQLFQNSAYACSPKQGRSIQFIQNVEIMAANNVIFASPNDSIKKGESITDRFGFASYLPNNFEPLLDVVKEEIKLNFAGSFYIGLNSAPIQPTTLMVNVEVTLSDGKVFTFENEILKVR